MNGGIVVGARDGRVQRPAEGGTPRPDARWLPSHRALMLTALSAGIWTASVAGLAVFQVIELLCKLPWPSRSRGR